MQGCKEARLFGGPDEALRDQFVWGKARRFQGSLRGRQSIEVDSPHSDLSVLSPPSSALLFTCASAHASLGRDTGTNQMYNHRTNRVVYYPKVGTLCRQCHSGIFAVSLQVALSVYRRQSLSKYFLGAQNSYLMTEHSDWALVSLVFTPSLSERTSRK